MTNLSNPANNDDNANPPPRVPDELMEPVEPALTPTSPAPPQAGGENNDTNSRAGGEQNNSPLSTASRGEALREGETRLDRQQVGQAQRGSAMPETLPTAEPAADDMKSNQLLGDLKNSHHHIKQISDLAIISAGYIGALRSQEGPAQDLQNNIIEKKIVSQEQAPELAKQIIALEQSDLFKGLKAQIEQIFPEAGEREKDAYEIEIKKSFYELLASPGMNAETISRLFSKINIAEKPPENIAHAVASIKIANHKAELNLYKESLTAENCDLAHIIKHEAGHILAHLALRDEINAINSVISNLISHPELVSGSSSESHKIPEPVRDDSIKGESSPIQSYVLSMLRDPAAAASLEHRQQGHLKRELVKFADFKRDHADDAAAIARKQQDLAQEIIADRIANYMESGGNLQNYLTLRFNAEVPGQPDEAVFAREKSLFEALDGKLKQIPPPETDQQLWPDDYYDEWGAYDLPEPTPPMTDQTADPALAKKKRDVLTDLFDWLTGNKQPAR